MMSICLTRVPISGLGEPYIYHDSGVFYKKEGKIVEGICTRIDGCKVVSGTCPTCVIDKVWE